MNTHKPSDPKREDQSTAIPPADLHRKRPYWLRVMLSLWIFFSAISAFIYLRSLSGVWIAITPLHHPAWTLPILFALSLLNLVCTIAIWKWRKWGMYGLAFSGAILFIITLISLNLTNAVISTVGIVIIALLVRKVWPMMI